MRRYLLIVPVLGAVLLLGHLPGRNIQVVSEQKGAIDTLSPGGPAVKPENPGGPSSWGTSQGQTPLGVAPATPSTCPADHAIKGYASRRSETGVYFLPGSAAYERVKPQRCFSSEAQAREAGYRSGREERPPATDDGRSRRRQP